MLMSFLGCYVIAGLAFAIYDYLANPAAQEVYRQRPMIIVLQVLRWPIAITRRIRNSMRPSPKMTSGLSLNDSSFYRRWTATHEKQLLAQPTLDDAMIFVGLMIFLSKLDPTELDVVPIPHEKPKQLGDDAALFEAGCYLISIIDRWIYSRYPDRRESFIRRITDRFIQLSSEALATPAPRVGKLFNLRLEKYGEMHRGSRSERDMLDLLTDYITHAMECGSIFEGSDIPPILEMVRLNVQVHVLTWAGTFVKASLEMLEKYFADIPRTSARESNSTIARTQSGSASAEARHDQGPTIGSPEWRQSHALCFVASGNLLKVFWTISQRASDWIANHPFRSEEWHDASCCDDYKVGPLWGRTDAKLLGYAIVLGVAAKMEPMFMNCRVHRELEKSFMAAMDADAAHPLRASLGLVPSNPWWDGILTIDMVKRFRKAAYAFAKQADDSEDVLFGSTLILKDFIKAPSCRDALRQMARENVRFAKQELERIAIEWRAQEFG